MDSWRLDNVWNECLDASFGDRATKPRDYIRASEIGKGYLDIFLSQMGEQPTTPADFRARRKMEAGSWIEAIVKMVLFRAGILRKAEIPIILQEDGLLDIHGRIDFIAGGTIHWDEAKKALDSDIFQFLGGHFVKKKSKKIKKKAKSFVKQAIRFDKKNLTTLKVL